MIPNSADRALPQAPTLPDLDRTLPAAVFRNPPVDIKAPAQTLPQALWVQLSCKSASLRSV